jgi:DNA repair protein RecN (Recombination protein N)
MLEELSIHNYALIERVNVKFTKGLNVLTGETGAGKSILVDALSLLLGQRTDPSTIRSGASETLVSGLIRISDSPEVLQWLDSHGITPEDGTIIIRRVVKKSGRGSIFVQSAPMTRAELSELTSMLFDIHGQHEHQSLLKAGSHRALLDRFGGTEFLAIQASELYTRLAALKRSYSKAMKDERERRREIDLLSHAISEIEAAHLTADEEESLEKEHRILANHEKLAHLIEEVYTSISESRGGALAQLRRSRDALEEMLQIDTSLSKLENQLQDAFYELEDFSESIRFYKSSFEFNPDRLASVEERLFQIRDLERKYGDTVAEVLQYAEKCKSDLEELENWEDKKKTLEAEIKKVEQELQHVATELSEKRKSAAAQLEKLIEDELIHLGMPKVHFKVLVQIRKDEQGEPAINQYGMDLVEFVISPNPGEPYKRLIKIASGGEISRVMLAIKSILVESDHINALIFDEVDTGIGGEVALAVGERLHKLSKIKQILCVTHLATIAVRADNHLKVEKFEKDRRTVTNVTRVRGKEKMVEISRMLAGDSKNEVALKHAEDLLKKYAISSSI